MRGAATGTMVFGSYSNASTAVAYLGSRLLPSGSAGQNSVNAAGSVAGLRACMFRGFFTAFEQLEHIKGGHDGFRIEAATDFGLFSSSTIALSCA